MPIYFYKCSDCGEGYEFIGKYDDRPSCVKCQSSNQVKQLTSFAVGSLRGAEKTPMESSSSKPSGHVHSGACCPSASSCSADKKADALIKKYLD